MGICGNRLNVALTAFVKERRLGLVAPQDTGFKLKSDPTRCERPMSRSWRKRACRVASYRSSTGTARLTSPLRCCRPASGRARSTRRSARYSRLWCHGRLGRPTRTRTVTVHHRGGPAHLFAEGDLLEDPVVMPGFRYPLKDLFEDLPSGDQPERAALRRRAARPPRVQRPPRSPEDRARFAPVVWSTGARS